MRHEGDQQKGLNAKSRWRDCGCGSWHFSPENDTALSRELDRSDFDFYNISKTFDASHKLKGAGRSICLVEAQLRNAPQSFLMVSATACLCETR
jgi:hypothetical protein